jgi:hypothetical protein
VGQLRELLLHRCHDARVHMAGVEHRNATGKVDVATALDVPELGVLSPLDIDAGRIGHAASHCGTAAAVQIGIGCHGPSSPFPQL